MSENETKLEVGDQIAVRKRPPATGYDLHTIRRITPSGRYVCDNITFDSNFRIRGQGTDPFSPLWGESATSEIKRRVKRDKVQAILSRYDGWNEMDDEDLFTVFDIVSKYRKKNQP